MTVPRGWVLASLVLAAYADIDGPDVEPTELELKLASDLALEVSSGQIPPQAPLDEVVERIAHDLDSLAFVQALQSEDDDDPANFIASAVAQELRKLAR